jgi:hypothetical protein
MKQFARLAANASRIAFRFGSRCKMLLRCAAHLLQAVAAVVPLF